MNIFRNETFVSSQLCSRAPSFDGPLSSSYPSTDQQGSDRAGPDRGAEPAEHHQGLPRLPRPETQPPLADTLEQKEVKEKKKVL